jgi:hypothetical protein
MKRIIVAISIFGLMATLITVDGISKGASQYRNIQLFINQKIAYVDGKSIELEAPPTIINNKTVVPLRFLQENALQSCSTIAWDAKDKKITLQIPLESLDCETYTNLQSENTKLKDENKWLRAELDRCKKNDGSQDGQVPPISYGPKNGVKFILKSIVKDRDSIRIDVVVENVSNEWLRFPASLTQMKYDDKEYQCINYDSIFSSRINGGQKIAGYIKFPMISTTGSANFTFTMWPQNTLKYFTFDIKVDLEQAIPASKR